MSEDDIKKLFKRKGFSLNVYPDSVCWEFIVTDDEKLKEKICKIFGAKIDYYDRYTDIDTLILQCREDFSNCIFYYDCNPFDMRTEDFIFCVSKMDDLRGGDGIELWRVYETIK